MKNRAEKIAYMTSHYQGTSSKGLELSPDINPMLKKRDGYNVEYLDARTTQELQAQAIEKGRDISCAPEVHYLHDFKQSIATCVGHKTFDYVVSSHVIEHVPDLVGHFKEVKEILNDGGTYAFLAPDKDLCFDAQKSASSLGQILEAHLEARKVAPISALIDEYVYGVKRAGSGAWSNSDQEPFTSKYPNANQLIQNVLRDPSIAANWHGHIWRFTPTSFIEIFCDLGDLGLVDLRLIDVVPTNYMEFIVVLGA
jgi:SAM-dependent methyltransferase